MFGKKNVSGFTLVELLVVSVIVSILIGATGTAVRFVLTELRHSEKKQMAIDESLDLDFYVRRSVKNISNSRLNMPTTYVASGASFSSRGANLPGRPLPFITITKSQWVPVASVNPLRTVVDTHFSTPTRSLNLDSFNLEEHRLVSVGNTLEKKTRRIVISRCDEWSRFIDLTDGKYLKDPSLTAYYLLNMIPRRPFFRVDPTNAVLGLNCCLPSNPNCKDGNIHDYYFRSYAITLDNAEKVIAVEEFPKTSADNSIVGSGFGMYFPVANSMSSEIRTFTLKNRCQTNSKLDPGICAAKLSNSAFFNAVKKNLGLIEVQSRTIGIKLSSDIAATGIISL